MRVKIVLIDDHPIYREGLRYVIRTQSDMKVSGEAADESPALELVRTTQPDVILMDIALASSNGIDVCQKILSEYPRAKIIILTAFADAEYVNRAIKTGIKGYLLKGSGTDEIIRAIRAVMAGHTYLCPEITSAVMAVYKNALQTTAEPPKTLLSAREREVLKWIAEGLSTKEIAARLDIGAKTVETYRRRLMVKLECNRATELVRYALREGIVSLE